MAEEVKKQKPAPDPNSAKARLGRIALKAYTDCIEAKKRGEMVGWCSSNFPVEIPETLGLYVCYPENQAAGIAARGGGERMCNESEGDGYSNDICAYARISLAYMDVKDAPELNMPQPDFVACCNNICNEVIKWYENIARERNIPLIMIDTTYNYDYEVSDTRIKYLRDQFEEAIRQLEIISGKKFDPKRLEEVMKISSENGKLWKYSMSLPSGNFPSPMNGFDLFTYMAVIVCARGKKETTEAFKLLIEYLEENARKGESSFRGEEKYRIMMEGIPCWPYIGFKMKSLAKYGVNMTGSVYPYAWALEYEKNDLDGLAKAYSSMFNNVNIERMTELLDKHPLKTINEENVADKIKEILDKVDNLSEKKIIK